MKNIADILSESHFFNTPKKHEAEHSVNYIVSNSIPKTLKFYEIQEATQSDQILTEVCDVKINNRWRFHKNDIHMKPYCILLKERIFHDSVISYSTLSASLYP